MATLEDFLNTFGAPLAPGDSWADRAQRASAMSRKEDRAMWMKNGYELGDGTWLPLNKVYPQILYRGLENMFGKWDGEDAREYVKFKHSQGSITDLQVQAMKDMGAPYWPDPRKKKGRRAMDEYWTGSHEKPRFILDMGHKVIATSAGPDGKTIKLDLGRYSVWAYDERGKDKVIATGNNLRQLKKKYGKHLEVIPIRKQGPKGEANRRKTGKTDARNALRAYRAGRRTSGFAGRKRIWIAPYQKSDGSWVGGHHRWETPKARKARMISATAGRKRKK